MFGQEKSDNMKRLFRKIVFAVTGLTAIACNKSNHDPVASTLDTELTQKIETTSLGKGLSFYVLPESYDYAKIPQDPKNPLSEAKVELGKLLFHETALGQNPKKMESYQSYSCASCHHGKAGFQACVSQGIGEGGTGFGIQGEKRVVNSIYKASEIDVQPVKSPSALNIAYQKNILWNGQFGGTALNAGTQSSWTKGTPKENNNLGYEGVETQAIAGREVHRLVIDKILISNLTTYKNLYTKAFDAASIDNPAQLKMNGSLAIAAYERTLLANQAPFQQWLKGNKNAMTDQEKRGAVLFFGKAECTGCHNGPSLANMEFHAIGMKDFPTSGNIAIHNVKAGSVEFKGRGGFTGKAEDMYKFKVPQLYNLTDSPFYGHGSSMKTIEEVLKYKNIAKKENSTVPDSQISPKFHALNLTDAEIADLASFVKNGLRDPNLMRYVPKTLPSGLAFPNNDRQSRIDLGF